MNPHVIYLQQSKRVDSLHAEQINVTDRQCFATRRYFFSWPFLLSTYQPTVRKIYGKLCDNGLRSQSDRNPCPSRSSLSISACVNWSRNGLEERGSFPAGAAEGAGSFAV